MLAHHGRLPDAPTFKTIVTVISSGIINLDGFVKILKLPIFVIPAKAGIQLFQDVLDPGFRRGDDPSDFLRDHHL
ncbi:MAG: hypothetical protein NTV04_10380 [Deltaproteobacteria bacterium]|nr:hypothetical protein [Deltaproteobacteria bacterium]